MRLRTLELLVIFLWPLSRGTHAQELARSTTIPMPEGESARAFLLADVDGDGRSDLIVSASPKEPGRRSLRLHRRRSVGVPFVAEPDARWDVTSDACAFSVADVHPDPGREIVIYNAKGAFAYRPKAAEESRYVMLFACSLLWQVANERGLIPWTTGVADLDGDGLEDLLIPEPSAYRVALQRRDGDVVRFETSLLRIPRDDAGGLGRRGLEMQGRQGRLSLRLELTPKDQGAGWSDGGPVVQVLDDVPAPQLLDFDGDGRLDICCQGRDDLHLWQQDASGRFPDTPRSTPLPIAADRDRRLDVSYSAHLFDMNGDRRADALFLGSDRRSKEARTQVLLFTQGAGQPPESPVFGRDGMPQQLLIIDGFAGIPDLLDVDGDGRLDLVVGAVRPDLLDRLRSGGDRRIEAEIYVFPGDGQKFARRPSLLFEVEVPADGLRRSRRELTARFFADITGDGTRELLLRDRDDRLRILYLRKDRSGALSIPARPVFELAIQEDADVVPYPTGSDRPEIVIREKSQVIHVRF